MAPRSCLQVVFGGTFALVVFCVISLVYYLYVFKVFLPLCHSDFNSADTTAVLLLLIFHLLLSLQLWSLFQTMLTDPGQVPPYWGFYIGDAETKRKRYCLMCHVFKPERCHHCSICNRCVLNMDHHCRKRYTAWVNNCIGFYNRKYFILLLMYTLVLMYYIVATMFPIVYRQMVILSVPPSQTSSQPDLSRLPIIALFLFISLLSLVLTAFFKFHIHLVLTNSTTIENLEQPDVVSKFTLGPLGNWMQVFGRNPWLWPWPIMSNSGKPLGDGVTWAPEATPHPSDDFVQDSVRNSVESPRVSTAVRKSMSAMKEQLLDVSAEATEEQNPTTSVIVNLSTLKPPEEHRPGRHSDVDTDSSFLTNAALMQATAVAQDDSILREMSAKLESPQPSPLQSPGGVLEISLTDPQFFKDSLRPSQPS